MSRLDGEHRDAKRRSRGRQGTGKIMPINIDKLTEAELIDLNHRIVERLRFLQQMRAHAKMLEFKIGDRVVFQAEGGRPVEGVLTRYNRKTVTVITDDGRQRNVSPALLSKAVPATSKAHTRSNVVSLK
jgi:ribosomal protein S17